MYQLTPERQKELKKAHGDIFLVEFDDAACVLKTPSRKQLSYATKAAEKDPLAFNETMLKACWIEGDEIIQTDDGYFLGVSNILSEVISVKEASIKKL